MLTKRKVRNVLERVGILKPPLSHGSLPDWPSMLKGTSNWEKAIAGAKNGPPVMIPTLIGGDPQLTVLESSLGIALTLRGAKVDVMLCDGVLPACQRAKIAGIAPTDLVMGKLKDVFCSGCMDRGNQVFQGTGLHILRVGDLLTEEERNTAKSIAAGIPFDSIPAFSHNGLPLGEHALAGALRYYGRGDFSGEEEAEGVLRCYLEAALLVANVMTRSFAEHNYNSIVVNHGIYVPHGITAAIAREAGIRIVSWNLAYRKQCAIFSHNDTYHHTLMNESANDWEDFCWTSSEEKKIVSYLDSRKRGGRRDWIWFNNQPDDDLDKFAAETGLDWEKPTIGMLTNVVWDAQLHYPANAFPNMIEWAIKTVAYFETHQDLQLVIRVHPGELAPPGGSTKSRQPMAGELKKAFPRFPKNVFIIPPESQLSTYQAMERCNAVIIYGTKTGVELASTGKQVIVAGEAWIRNKGLTRDACSEAEYFKILDQLPFREQLDPKTVQRARKYAYHFFFRRMIPLPYLEPKPGAWPPYIVDIQSVNDLSPGEFRGLDVICDGILNGGPFIYKAEVYGVHDF